MLGVLTHGCLCAMSPLHLYVQELKVPAAAAVVDDLQVLHMQTYQH